VPRLTTGAACQPALDRLSPGQEPRLAHRGEQGAKGHVAALTKAFLLAEVS
jgi:hypothetical protein